MVSILKPASTRVNLGVLVLFLSLGFVAPKIQAETIYADAKPPAAPVTPALTFKAWKEQQILESQNLVLRTSSRLHQIKSGRQSGAVVQVERQLQRAHESVEFAKGLSLEDYFTIYLPSLEGRTEAIDQIALQLSKEEVTELLRTWVKKTAPVESADDAKQKNSILGKGLRPDLAQKFSDDRLSN